MKKSTKRTTATTLDPAIEELVTRPAMAHAIAAVTDADLSTAPTPQKPDKPQADELGELTPGKVGQRAWAHQYDVARYGVIIHADDHGAVLRGTEAGQDDSTHWWAPWESIWLPTCAPKPEDDADAGRFQDEIEHVDAMRKQVAILRAAAPRLSELEAAKRIAGLHRVESLPKWCDEVRGKLDDLIRSARRALKYPKNVKLKDFVENVIYTIAGADTDLAV